MDYVKGGTLMDLIEEKKKNKENFKEEECS